MSELTFKEYLNNYFIDSMYESLKEGYVDYCYSKDVLLALIGKCRRNKDVTFIFNPVVEDGHKYYILIPVGLYRSYMGQDQRIRGGFVFNKDEIPNRFKIKVADIIVKDYNKVFDWDSFVEGVTKLIAIDNSEDLEEDM